MTQLDSIITCFWHATVVAGVLGLVDAGTTLLHLVGGFR